MVEWHRHIRKNFSSAAPSYETYACLQKNIGGRLLARIPKNRDFRMILDVGMGTGEFTGALAACFPTASVTGMDFAGGMVQEAGRKNRFYAVQADASALPFKPGTFDLIVSNAAYQWVDDLEKAFKLNFTCLRDRGMFCCSLFCRNSLAELFSSLENGLHGSRKKISLRRLSNSDSVREAVSRAGFVDISVEQENIKMHFPDMLSLMRWLKRIGANTNISGTYIGKDRLMRANEYYKQNFAWDAGVCASFEVAWITAEKCIRRRNEHE